MTKTSLGINRTQLSQARTHKANLFQTVSSMSSVCLEISSLTKIGKLEIIGEILTRCITGILVLKLSNNFSLWMTLKIINSKISTETSKDSI
jgi:hypothetical protein